MQGFGRLVLIWLALAGGLAGCAQFPELDAVTTRGVAKAPYPGFEPLDVLLSGPVPQITGSEAARLKGRAQALRSRADRLRRSAGAPRGVEKRLARLRLKAEELRAQ